MTDLTDSSLIRQRPQDLTTVKVSEVFKIVI
jgi:hypothetical protein